MCVWSLGRSQGIPCWHHLHKMAWAGVCVLGARAHWGGMPACLHCHRSWAPPTPEKSLTISPLLGRCCGLNEWASFTSSWVAELRLGGTLGPTESLHSESFSILPSWLLQLFNLVTYRIYIPHPPFHWEHWSAINCPIVASCGIFPTNYLLTNTVAFRKIRDRKKIDSWKA